MNKNKLEITLKDLQASLTAVQNTLDKIGELSVKQSEAFNLYLDLEEKRYNALINLLGKIVFNQTQIKN